MKLRTLGFGALTGVLLTAPLIAVLYLADKWLNLSFPPFDTFDWTAGNLPGAMVTFGIDAMIETLMLVGLSVKDFAKTAEQIMATMLFLGAGVVATIIIFALVERRVWSARPQLGALCGVIVGIPVAIITFSIGQSTIDPTLNFLWVMIASVAWGTASALVARRLIEPERTVIVSEDGERSVAVMGRRQFLVRMGVATATITVAGAGIGRVMAGNEKERLEAELAAMKDRIAESAASGMIELPNEDDPVKPALGTRPEYTAVRDHYKIFIRSQPSVIDGDTYTLPITGSVENPMSLTIDDIRNRYEARNEFVTLACISNRVGGDLISTTYWTGASLQDILADLKPLPSANHLFIESEDGFFETVSLDLIASDPRIMLAYNWDGPPYSVRSWLPTEDMAPGPLRHEAAEVDNQHPGHRRVQARILGGAGLGRGRADARYGSHRYGGHRRSHRRWRQQADTRRRNRARWSQREYPRSKSESTTKTRTRESGTRRSCASLSRTRHG